MEPQFKSSFIPKAPVTPTSQRQMRSRPLGVLFFLASVALVGIVVLTGGVFGYGRYLEEAKQDKSDELNRTRQDFQPALIEELRRVSSRMAYAQTLINRHLALSPLFKLLETSTLYNVQYLSFAYAEEPEGGLMLKLEGKTRDFKSLAQQAKVLSQDASLRDVTFSNFAVDEKGDVHFMLALMVNPDVVSYRNLVEPLSPAPTAPLEEVLPPAASSTEETASSTTP